MSSLCSMKDMTRTSSLRVHLFNHGVSFLSEEHKKGPRKRGYPTSSTVSERMMLRNGCPLAVRVDRRAYRKLPGLTMDVEETYKV